MSLESRVLSAVLVGVNRAFPFAKEDMELYVKEIDSLFLLAHNTTFNTSLHVFMLLHQVTICYLFFFYFFFFMITH